MRKELEKYGIQMPAFSKIGGILESEVCENRPNRYQCIVRFVSSENNITLVLSLLLAYCYHCYYCASTPCLQSLNHHHFCSYSHSLSHSQFYGYSHCLLHSLPPCSFNPILVFTATSIFSSIITPTSTIIAIHCHFYSVSVFLSY